MTDAEILRMKLNLTKCSLDDKQKEEFLTKLDDFHDLFSLRDEIGTYPFIEVHLKVKDETPFFCKTLPYERRTKESYTKGNGQTSTSRYYSKRNNWLQLTSCPS